MTNGSASSAFITCCLLEQDAERFAEVSEREWVTYVPDECCLPPPGSNSKRQANISAERRRRRSGDRVPRRVGPGVTRRRGPAGVKSVPTTDSDGRRPGRGTRSRQARSVPTNAEAPGQAPSRSKEGDDASPKHPNPSSHCPWNGNSERQRWLLAEDIADFNESFFSLKYVVQPPDHRKAQKRQNEPEGIVDCPKRLKTNSGLSAIVRTKQGVKSVDERSGDDTDPAQVRGASLKKKKKTIAVQDSGHSCDGIMSSYQELPLTTRTTEKDLLLPLVPKARTGYNHAPLNPRLCRRLLLHRRPRSGYY